MHDVAEEAVQRFQVMGGERQLTPLVNVITVVAPSPHQIASNTFAVGMQTQLSL